MKIKTILTTFLLSLCMAFGGIVLINKPVTTSQNYNAFAVEGSPTEISQAEKFTYQDIAGEDGVEITGFNNVTETLLDVKFPSTSDTGKPVTRIADGAFRCREDEHVIENKYKIVSITIPSSIKSIGYRAFYLNTELTTVTFAPESQLETIGEYAFAGEVYCSDYESSHSGRDYNSTYSLGTNKISSINIPKSVTSIGSKAFYLCGNLTDVTFETVETDTELTIGEYAFAGEIEYSSRESYDGYSSYYKTAYNNQISSIIFPKRLTSIGSHAFYLCKNLTDVTFQEGSKLQTIGEYAFAGESYEQNYDRREETEGYSVTTVGISTLEIPKGVTEISDYAFYLCGRLNALTFEKESSLNRIGSHAFAGTVYTESSNRDPEEESSDSVTTKITTLEIPKSVTEIGDYAFYLCGSLNTLTFEEESSLNKIGSRAFAGTIYTSSYREGRSSSKISITPDITTLEIPKSVTEIGEYAFYLCGSLNTLTFKKESLLNKIGKYAFAGGVVAEYTNLDDDDAKETGICPQISTLEIPKNVTEIGDYAFYMASELTQLTFESGTKLQIIGNYAFTGDAALYVDTSEKDERLTVYINKIKNIEIPETVTSIGEYAFAACSELETVTFSGTSQLQTIGAHAFAGKTFSREYYISGEGDKELEQECFNKIQNIIIPKSVQSIGNYAFSNCTSLSEVTFEDQSQLTTIGDHAFTATILPDIQIPKSVESIGSYSFNISTLSTLTFEAQSQLSTIGTSAFENAAISDLIIPENVTSIGASAFKSCAQLANVKFAGNVLTNIGSSAFVGCTQISEITLPGSVTTLGSSAFDVAITTIYLANKTQYDALSSNLTAYSEKTTYQITITFQDGEDVTRTDYKLWKKGLEWEKADDVWTSGHVYTLPDGIWLDDGGEEVTVETLNQKFESGEIADNITLTKKVLLHRIDSNITGIYATSDAGFEEGTQLNVTTITEVDQIKAQIGEDLYNENIQKIYVIEIQGTKPADYKIFVSSTCEILGDKLAVLGENELTDVTVSGETLLFENKTGTAVVSQNPPVELLHRIDSNITGIYATSEAGFEEGTQLNVTTITDADQIKAQIGEDLYNENIQKIYVIEIQGNKPVDYKIFVSSTCEILGDKLAVLGENELTDVTVSGETLLFENKTGTAVVSQNPPVELLHRIDSNITGIYATSDAGFEEGTQLNVTTITEVDQIKAQIGEDLYNENIQKIYVIEIQGNKPVDYKIFVSSTCEILGDKLAVLGENELTDVTVSGETLLFENKTGTAVVSQNPPAPPTDPDPVDPDPDAPDDENPTDTDNKDKSGKSLWWLWLLIALVVLLLILLIIFLVWKRRREEDSASE